MGGPSRSERYYKEISDFVADETVQTIVMVQYKSELRKIEKFFIDRGIAVEVTDKKYFPDGKVKFTLKKI